MNAAPTPKSRKPKRLLLFVVSSVMTVFLLTFLINLVFFHKPTVIYGANTICYTNNLNNNYHTKDCGFLNDTPTKMLLWDAIESGYVDCPDCDANIYLTVPCYITKQGECFHREKCHYIENSKASITIAFDAIKNNYRPCSHCFSLIDINEYCIVLPSGLYFHKASNTSQRNTKQLSHTITLDQDSRQDLRIKGTTVYKAIKRNHPPCSYCNVGILDASNGYTNNYLASSLISLFTMIVVWGIVFIIKVKKTIKPAQNC